MALLPDSFYTRISTSSATALRWTGKFNIPLYRLSGGRIGGHVGDAPVLLLTTTGRKSGQQRTAPVVYMRDGETAAGEGANGERLVVIGSNAGHSNEPAWSLNLKANPEAEVEVGRKHSQVRARIAAGEERAELWRKINDLFSGFDTYESRTDRDIAVFVLDPR